jgi:hypothetical protein
MNQKTAPHFNFLPHIEAYQQWEEFKQIRQAQLGIPTRVSTPHTFDWVIGLARIGYQAMEKEAPGSSRTVGSLVVSAVAAPAAPRPLTPAVKNRGKRVKKLRGQRDRAA